MAAAGCIRGLEEYAAGLAGPLTRTSVSRQFQHSAGALLRLLLAVCIG